MESNDIHVLIEQRHRRVALARWVEPRIEPNDLDLGLRVDRAHAQSKRIDALQHLRNGETCDVTCHVAGGHASTGYAGQIPALVIAGIGHRHVGRCLVTRNGLEPDVRKLLRCLQGRLHVTKTGRKNELVTGRDQIANDTFCVRSFGHVFDVSGLDPGPQGRFNCTAPFVMLANPPHIIERRHIKKTGLERGSTGQYWIDLGISGRNKTSGRERGGEVFVHGSPLHGSET